MTISMLYNNIKKWIPLSSSGMTVRVSSNMTEPNLSFRGLTTESITEKANDNCESSNTMKKLN